MLTTSSFFIIVDFPSSAEESTPFTAIRIFSVSSSGESSGFTFNNASSSCVIVMSDFSSSNFSVGKDFLAPPTRYSNHYVVLVKV